MSRNFILFLLFNCAGFLTAQVSSDDADQLEASLQRQYDNFVQTGVLTNEMEGTFSKLQFPGLFRRGYKSQSRGIVECFACSRIVKSILNARRSGVSAETLSQRVASTCALMKLESPENCKLIVDIQLDTLIYIVDNKKDLTSARVCSILMQNMNCKDNKRKDWVIEIPQKTNDVKINKESVGYSRKPLKVLQITDMHYDPEYTIGSNAACDGGQCCRKGSTPSSPENAAGRWGDYRNCDISLEIVTDALDHITAQHKDLDYVMFTGDIIDHKVWSTNIEYNSEIITEIFQLFKEKFGRTPVIPILGNHEPHPVNVFSLDKVGEPKLSTQWIFDLSADLWTTWLPSVTSKTILKGGYYTYLIRQDLRIVALNSNVCYNFNWWLLYDDTDQFGQLEWLVSVLLEAERNGEKVHLLSHVPSAEDDCLKNWSKEFTKIINRFSNTIVAQFNGHTHHDANIIYFNGTDSSQAIGVAFNGGSLTTYSNVNPNYVVYHVDPRSFEVLDYDMWTYNVTEANLRPDFRPNWFKLYSFKHAYNVPSLKPQELANLVERMAGNRKLAEQYYSYKYREADSALAIGCDDECHKSNLCYMVTSYYSDNFHCKRLIDIWNSAHPK